MKRIKRLIYRIFDRYLRKKAIKNHRKMWRWLAEHPDKSKCNYLMLHDPKGEELLNNCYLCDYAKLLATLDELISGKYCKYCPLDWDGNECPGFFSLYSDWHHTRNNEERVKIARQIAELPERKDR